MDKAQKELNKTYWRARSISAPEGGRTYRYTKYELQPEFLRNGYIDIDSLQSYQIVNFLMKNPQDMKYLIGVKDKLYDNIDTFDPLVEIAERRLVDLLVKRPELAQYFDLQKLSGADVHKLLRSQPQFAEELKDRIKPLRKYKKMELLQHQPDLLPYIDTSEYDSGEIQSILHYQPSLAKHFEPRFKEFTELDVIHLFQDQPELVHKYWDMPRYRNRNTGNKFYDETEMNQFLRKRRLR